MRAFLTSLTVVALAPVAALAADLYLVNGKVFTGDDARPFASAVAIRDGKIAAVGDDAAVRAMAGGRAVDLGGRLVVPGLVEAHGHAGASSGGRDAPMPNLPWPGPTPEEAIAAVSAAASQGPGWIEATIGPLVVNDPRDWRAALDAAAPNNPVMIRPWWGHGTFMNSAALKALGVADDARDPLGGWYTRRPDGRLDGRARENAEWRLGRARTAGLPVETFAAAYRATAGLYAGWGVTTYHQMLNNQALADAMPALRMAGVPIKWRVYGWGMPERRVEDAWSQFEGQAAGQGRVRIAGIKWVLDSTPIERDAHMSVPYADRPGWRGRSNYTDDQLRDMLGAVLAHPDQQPAFHVSGDGELARLLDAMEAAAPAATWRARRVRIEHADGLVPSRFGQARRLGVVVIQNPLHLDPMPDAKGVPLIVARLGDRAREFELLKTLVAAGVPFALGSDAGGPPANPFLNMMIAITSPNAPAEGLTREQALKAYTQGGAFAEGEEELKGRIAPGMAADLAVLSQDILTVPLGALPGTRSLLTLVDGAPAHAEGPFAALAAADR